MKENEVESGRGMGVLLTRSAAELSPAYKHVGASQWRVWNKRQAQQARCEAWRGRKSCNRAGKATVRDGKLGTEEAVTQRLSAVEST